MESVSCQPYISMVSVPDLRRFARFLPRHGKLAASKGARDR
jgi:hypothetical protein